MVLSGVRTSLPHDGIWSSGAPMFASRCWRRPESAAAATDAAGALLLRPGKSPGMKGAADHFLIPEHRHLCQRALSVIDRPLPSQPTALLNQLDVAVSLGRGGFGRAPQLIWAE